MRSTSWTAAALLSAALIAPFASAPARAQDTAAADNVFMEAGKNADGKPIVTFVFSDGAKTGFAPKDAFTVEMNPKDPKQKTCAFDFDAKPEISDAAKAKPVYGPASGRAAINPLKLPSFFSQIAANDLLKKKIIAKKQEVAPIFNCTGLAWALILSDPPKKKDAKAE